VLAFAFLVLCGPVIIQPLASYFRQPASVLAQAQ
jgi:hypothetical protein